MAGTERLDSVFEEISVAIKEKTLRPNLITPLQFADEIRTIKSTVEDFEDDEMRNELIYRGYDVPLNKSDAYYRSIVEAKYQIVENIIKLDGKYPRIILPDFVDFNASEYQAELRGYIKTSTQGTTSFFSSRIDGDNGGKFDFLRNKGGNTLRFVKNGVQTYVSNFNTNWHTFYLGDEGLTVDTTFYSWKDTPQPERNCIFPVCLFASDPMSSTDFSVGNNFGECGFEYLKFFHFGRLIYYFFPVYIDNEICLCDAVNDRLYHNDGLDYFTTTDPSVDIAALEANSIQSRIIYNPTDDEDENL